MPALELSVATGDYDILTNRLKNEADPDTGGFYIVEHSASGFRLLGSVAVPCSRVAIDGTHAYLAAGSGGLVVVDIADLSAPRVLSRLDDNPAYDVDVRGNTVYVAQGAKGIGTVDVTKPGAPVIVAGMEAAAGAVVEAAGFTARHD